MSNQDLINKFNDLFPVGAKVFWRSYAHDAYPHKEYEVRHEAYDMNGQPVAFLKGKAGCVSIEPEFVDYNRTNQPDELKPQIIDLPGSVKEVVEVELEREFIR